MSILLFAVYSWYILHPTLFIPEETYFTTCRLPRGAFLSKHYCNATILNQPLILSSIINDVCHNVHDRGILLDQVWSILPGLELLPLNYPSHRQKGSRTKAVRFWSCPLSQSRGRTIPHRPCMPKWAQTCGKILSQVGLKPMTSILRGWCSTNWWLPWE